MDFTELSPKIYKIVKVKDEFKLVVYKDRYIVRDNLIGPVSKILYRIKRLLDLGRFDAIDILATGNKGMGKTTTINTLANSLIDNGIPIIEVQYIKADIDLIQFLSNFRNVCIVMDEFGKYFDREMQEKALTLMNNKGDYFNIYILAENTTHQISDYFLDRMERLRYHIQHSRIADNDLMEYCKVNGIPEKISVPLRSINKVNSKISYDTLEVLADECKLFPELSFEDLTDPLNCKGIVGTPILTVADVSIDDSDDEYIESFNIVNNGFRSLEYVKEVSFLEYGYSININVIIKKTSDEGKEEDEDEVKDSSLPNNDFALNLSPYDNTIMRSNRRNMRMNLPPNNTLIRINSECIDKINDEDKTIECIIKQGKLIIRVILARDVKNVN